MHFKNLEMLCIGCMLGILSTVIPSGYIPTAKGKHGCASLTGKTR